MEQGDQKTVTSWCLKTKPVSQSLGKPQTQQNFQMVNMRKILKCYHAKQKKGKTLS